MNEERDAGNGTHDALIGAARPIFAQQGYDGASVRAITAAAGANLGAITYHFGSKRELYDRVVAGVVAPLAERLEREVAAEVPVLDRAERVVRAYFDYLSANPDLPQLMLQELALGGEAPAPVAVPLKRVHAALMRLVEEGQRAGVVQPGPAVMQSMFILSIPVHLAIMQKTVQSQLGVDLNEPQLRARVVDAVVRFVRAGLRGGQE